MASAGERRIPAWAPWALLVVSLIAHVLVTLAGSDPFKMIDLRVYLDGAQWALDGTLYDSTSNSTSSDGTPIVLPFTYPPFAALVFVPLAKLDYTLARVIWQAASVAALAGMVYLTLRMLGRSGPGTTAIVASGTALGIWLEPVRHHVQLRADQPVPGSAAARRRSGTAAGGFPRIHADRAGRAIPTTGLAVGGCRRDRWRRRGDQARSGDHRAVLPRLPPLDGGAVVRARLPAHVGAAAIVLPSETTRYFTELIFDPARTGPVFGAINQSWRGAIARLAGLPDLPSVWLLVVVVSVALALWALWRTVQRTDLLGSFLVVQFLGLLVSPISWSHHWVWVVPLLIWCLFGPRRTEFGVRALATAWSLACFSYLVSLLVAQPGNYEIPARPLWAAVAGTVYAVLGMLTLAVLGFSAAKETRDVGSAATRESGAPG